MLEPDRIGSVRKRLGLTQKQLADMSGVSQSLIAKIESGNIDPAYSKVMAIVAALEDRQHKGKKTVKEIMTSDIVSVSPGDTVAKAVKAMRKKGISQIPVIESDRCVGSISDSMIVELVSENKTDMKSIKVDEVMAENFPTIPSRSVVDVAADLLRYYGAVLVNKDGRLVGIVTKADLLKAI